MIGSKFIAVFTPPKLAELWQIYNLALDSVTLPDQEVCQRLRTGAVQMTPDRWESLQGTTNSYSICYS